MKGQACANSVRTATTIGGEARKILNSWMRLRMVQGRGQRLNTALEEFIGVVVRRVEKDQRPLRDPHLSPPPVLLHHPTAGITSATSISCASELDSLIQLGHNK